MLEKRTVVGSGWQKDREGGSVGKYDVCAMCWQRKIEEGRTVGGGRGGAGEGSVLKDCYVNYSNCYLHFTPGFVIVPCAFRPWLQGTGF